MTIERAPSLAEILAQHRVQASAQRLVIAEYVLFTRDHPTAEKVFAEVRTRIPMISRATVYNTLNLFVRQGLLRQVRLADGKVVFDPNLTPHHHFVDGATGEIHDVPWEALAPVDIGKLAALGLNVTDYQVFLSGTVSRVPAGARRRAAGRAPGAKP